MKVEVCQDQLKDKLVNELRQMFNPDYTISNWFLGRILIIKESEVEKVVTTGILKRTKTVLEPKFITYADITCPAEWNDTKGTHKREGKIVVYDEVLFKQLKEWGEKHKFNKIIKCWNGCC